MRGRRGMSINITPRVAGKPRSVQNKIPFAMRSLESTMFTDEGHIYSLYVCNDNLIFMLLLLFIHLQLITKAYNTT